MADYTMTVSGGTGTIMIRDHGNLVEFWIAAGNSTAFHYDMDWWWSSPHGSGGGVFRYNAGAGWQRVGYTYVSVSGNVSFRKEASGSTGLGGDTTLTVWLSRATVPSAPTSYTPTNVKHESMTFDTSDNSNGGASIVERQAQYSTSSSFSSATTVGLNSSGTVDRTGLTPGTTYYWRARVRNSVGWSGWSTTRSATTLPGVWIKVAGVWKRAVPYVKVAGVWKAAVAYVKSAGVWKTTDS